jgi:hypothetical protein
MSVRFALPVIAVALALGAVGGCSSNGRDQMAAQESSATKVRPAQMTEMSQCDQRVQEVEARLPTAKADKMPSAQADVRKAQGLCDSGDSAQAISILDNVQSYMDHE